MKTFRVHTLKHSEDTIAREAFTCDTILRPIFESLVGNIACRGFAPNRKLFVHGYGILSQARMFSYPTAERFNEGHHARFKVWLSDKVHEGKVLKGTTFTKTWVTFAVLKTLVVRYQHYVVQYGTLNYDKTL